MSDMIPFGDQLLEKTETGFKLSQPTIIWNFTREQLIAEIYRLEILLGDRKKLLGDVDKLG
jgi:hypothetical protein